jgi:SAM-dependent methyltransferase
MSVFGRYSRYYDLLYRDKDYLGEASYVDRLIRSHAPQARTLLDLGCGTGRHDLLFAEMGYRVTGVDLSEEMLAVASSQLPAGLQSSGSLEFRQGDLTRVRLGSRFDAVVSLFHVMSYQADNDDLRSAFATAKAHLEPGGLFVFDCWYGPAVLTDPPVVRVKRLEDDHISVTRIAEPVLHPNRNLVDVNYQVFIRDKNGEGEEELRETHSMRYLFLPELLLLLEEAGLSLVEFREWLTGKEPGFDTWSACFVVRG